MTYYVYIDPANTTLAVANTLPQGAINAKPFSTQGEADSFKNSISGNHAGNLANLIGAMDVAEIARLAGL